MTVKIHVWKFQEKLVQGENKTLVDAGDKNVLLDWIRPFAKAIKKIGILEHLQEIQTWINEHISLFFLGKEKRIHGFLQHEYDINIGEIEMNCKIS